MRKKQEFEAALLLAFRKLHLDSRRKMAGSDVLDWYLLTKKGDPYLKWDQCPGDEWQFAFAMLGRYFGPSALA